MDAKPEQRSLLDYRIGFGTDIHRIRPGGKLKLGGVEISDCEFGLAGHSDADVLLHAVTDAILGALGLDDIGTAFPDTDPANRDRSSKDFVLFAVQWAAEQGYRVSNLDCTVHAERPKIGPWRRKIRENLAYLLRVPIDRVNVKAKTAEKLGAIGSSEAIAADAIVLLTKIAD